MRHLQKIVRRSTLCARGIAVFSLGFIGSVAEGVNYTLCRERIGVKGRRGGHTGGLFEQRKYGFSFLIQLPHSFGEQDRHSPPSENIHRTRGTFCTNDFEVNISTQRIKGMDRFDRSVGFGGQIPEVIRICVNFGVVDLRKGSWKIP